MTEAPPETKPEYTTFNAGAGCEGNGAGSIKTLADCSAAGAALGLSDTPAVDDGQDGKSYDPPYCYFENGSLKFNSAGTNTGDCTDKDTCVCLASAPNACVGLGKDECKASKDVCKWMKDKTCIVRPPKDPSPPPETEEGFTGPLDGYDNKDITCIGGKKAYGSEEFAREKCEADPSCVAIHDFNCDGKYWRYCSRVTKGGDEKACVYLHNGGGDKKAATV